MFVMNVINSTAGNKTSFHFYFPNMIGNFTQEKHVYENGQLVAMLTDT